ncbi:hypothetical protein PM082_016628 [Marasmius tenuissimus]|nr:hypothetical protein PM082_016628 [Marasmius tenuissimus]
MRSNTHSRTLCAYADPKPQPKSKKSKTPKNLFSEDDDVTREMTRDINKAIREKKREWRATLVAAEVNRKFSWPEGTKGLYKTEAKNLFKFTEKEVLTLRAEHTAMGAPKSFVSLDDANDLAARKAEFFEERFVPIPDYKIPYIHKKTKVTKHNFKTNWTGTNTYGYYRR